MTIYQDIIERKDRSKKSLGVLIDPDDSDQVDIKKIIYNAIEAHADVILIGGSHILNNKSQAIIKEIKSISNIPVIQFPNATARIEPAADAILLLSLISGRNPDLLIGRHVENAALIKQSNLEVMPTGYILVDGGRVTSVEYMSNTRAIPRDKDSIIASTAIAGELLGMQLIYLEAGSGAKHHVPLSAISMVSLQLTVPLIVGGGIKTAEQAQNILAAGADMIIIGTAFEKEPQLIYDMSAVVHAFNSKIHHD